MTSPTPDESLHNLSLLALFISTHVQHALQSALVRLGADSFFGQHVEQRPSRFHTNPANTLPYKSLAALEDLAIVTIGETLNDEHGVFPITATIRRKEDIFLHRNFIGHPMTVLWRPAMRKFVDERHPQEDSKPALLWDLQRSVNEVLRAEGEPVHLEHLSVTLEMAHMLRLILELSHLPGLPLLSVEDYRSFLEERTPKYVQQLEQWVAERDATATKKP